MTKGQCTLAIDRNEFIEKLKQRPMLSDGGMGSLLIQAGLNVGECGELWNVDHPEKVRELHQAYVDAGCELLTTNTFGGSSTAMKRHELDGRTHEINKAGAQVAKQAGESTGALVMADIGPFGDFLEPVGLVTIDQLTAIFGEQLQAMHEGGADCVVIETMSDPAEVAVAIKVAKDTADWPIISTYAFQKTTEGEFRTMMGTTVEQAMDASREAGADVIGTNCGTSLTLEDYALLAEQLVDAAKGLPVIVQPNAGAPEQVDGQVVYPATPQQMADLAQNMIDKGVRIVGGCCGTTPDHLKAIAQIVKA